MDLNEVQRVLDKYDIKDVVELEALIKFAVKVGAYMKELDTFLDMVELLLDKEVDSFA